MNGLMIQTNGGKCVQRDELEAIPIPEATDSYQPVSHFVLANTLATIGQDLLRGYTLAKEQYGLARQGQQMFAVQTLVVCFLRTVISPVKARLSQTKTLAPIAIPMAMDLS